MDRYPKEEVVWHLSSIAEEGDLAHGVKGSYESFRMPVDPAFSEGNQQRLGGGR